MNACRSINVIVLSILVLTFSTSLVQAERNYTYILTVGMDPNNPDYDPCSNYETINAAIVAMNLQDPPLSDDVLGCIKIYPEPNGAPRTYIEHLNSYYEPNEHDLPAHCDLMGMGDDIADVVLQHGAKKIPDDVGMAGINGLGDNIISNLKVNNVYIYPNSNVQYGIHLHGDGKVENCIVHTLHAPAIEGDGHLVVSGCPEVSGMWGPSILANSTFAISDSTIKPYAYSNNCESPSGIWALGTGIIEDINIISDCASSTGVEGSGLFGIKFYLSKGEQVLVSNVKIKLKFRSKYNPSEIAPLRVCGILCTSHWNDPNIGYKGHVTVRDSSISVSGIEDTNNTISPNDDGAGMRVDGINVSEGFSVCIQETDVNTSRMAGGNAGGGYEYLLNNQDGTIQVDFNSVDFDPNGSNEPNCYDVNYVNGEITDYRVENKTQGTKYFYIQDAIDDANNGDEIEAAKSIYYETINFKGKAITLKGTDTNDWYAIESTIIDAENANYGVKFISGEDVNSVIKGVTIKNAHYGIYCDEDISLPIEEREPSSPTITRCIIKENSLGINSGNGSAPIIFNNKIIENSYVGIQAGGWGNIPTIKNNFIYGNGQKGIYCIWLNSQIKIFGNTIVNHSVAGISAAYCSISPDIENCIIWNCNEDLSGCVARYSCIENSFDSNDPNYIGCINSDPCFIDANIGNYGIQPYSLCGDAGDPDITTEGETDIDGEPRRMNLDGEADANSIIDIGADETFGKIFNVTRQRYYLSINDAVNDSDNNEEIIINEGLYHEKINFTNKEIILRSKDPNDWEIIKNTIIDGGIGGNAVTFNSGDGNSILKGLTIQKANIGIRCSGGVSPVIEKCILTNNSSQGIFCADNGTAPIIINNIIKNNNYGIYSSNASPVIQNNLMHNSLNGLFFVNAGGVIVRNNTIVKNKVKGISVSGSNIPSITNCIIWDCNDDLYGCTATYSCIQDGDSGTGNISSDPCFVNADANDFHLLSNSPCIDVGDPNGSYNGEFDIDRTDRVINIWGKGDDINDIDIGAYEYISVPAHWWKLDDGSGVIANDFAGDSNGTFSGDEPNWTTGICGGAVNLDGGSDYFSVSSLDNQYLASYDSTFSVSGWFKTGQTSGIQTIVGNWHQYSFSPVPGVNISLYYGWQILVENNKVVVRMGSSSTQKNIVGDSTVTDANWHHFAFVYPTEFSNSILYVDGQEEGTPQTMSCVLSDTKFRIGDGSFVSSGSPVMKGGPFKGIIDDVRIYNSVLSAEDAQRIFSTGCE